MGDDIAPDVTAIILDRCDETTLRNTHGDDPHIEVHEPFGDDRVSVKHGLPFLAIIERSADGTATVDTIGHFDYSNTSDGQPSVAVLRANYPPFDDDERFSPDEKEFIQWLIRNQYRPVNGPLPIESADWDWSGATLTGTGHNGYLVAEHDPDEFWNTGEHIYPNDNSLVDEDNHMDFDEQRRNELIEGTIEMLRAFAVDVAGARDDADTAYIVRDAQFHDIRDRAKELSLGAPPVTQTQAVSWALAELGLSQTRIATLRGKTQPTIKNHLERAAKHHVSAQKTADAFGSLPRYMQQSLVGDVRADIERDAADERFRFEKSLVTARLKCPECGLDAGEWDGGTHSGDWVGEPTQFWQASKTLPSFQNPRDPRHVECPDCGHTDKRSKFESAWTDEHGSVKHDGPEPF